MSSAILSASFANFTIGVVIDFPKYKPILNVANNIRPNALKSSVSKSNNSCSIFSPDTERSTAPLIILIFLIGNATDKNKLPFSSCLNALVFFPFKALSTSGKSLKENIMLSLNNGKFRGLAIKLENNETKFMKYFLKLIVLSTDGNGLILTNGAYLILTLVSAIKSPYILKS